MRQIFITVLAIICIYGNSQVPTNPAGKINNRQIALPYNRLIQPAGIQIFFGDEALENHALEAVLSPDGRWLAVLERYSIIFISTSDNIVKYRLVNNELPELSGGMNTYSGIIWHKRNADMEIYWSVIGNNKRSFVASAKWNGVKAEFGRLREYMAMPPADLALPNELIITNESNREYLYVILNGNNRVLKQDLNTDEIIWSVDPGVAPYGMTMASGKLYVTNWAGRNPSNTDADVAGVPWGLARVDKKNGSVREGSVAILNPSDGRIIKELVVGLHPNKITSDRSGKFVYLTNSNSDNITVIKTLTDDISETISVRLQPEINSYFGDSPDGLCLSADEKILYIANGMDNALAVIELGKNAAIKGGKFNSRVAGFIPVGAYPSSVLMAGPGNIYVSNLEASGVRLGLTDKSTANKVYNSHHMLASVSAIRIPGKKELQAYTDTVIALNNLSRSVMAREEPRKSVEPKTVPDRIGEPSVFKHVLYIIKENRTYDQVLGDMSQGDGDPGLCTYGSEVTPNTHKLSEEFMLLDNYHVSGKCSAEGHQWSDASIVTDYIEKNMRAWFRSYPHVQYDAMVYSPTGFLWDNATGHNRKVRIYGEAAVPKFDNKLKWTDIYNAYLRGEKFEFTNYTTISPVKDILSQNFPAFGNLEIPDILRADAFIKELNAYEAMDGDQLPELMIMALPNDHTAATRPNYPTPRALIADNDLALGRIVEAMTRSRFWENTVIFVTEDDSQSGWDHVSAFRTVGLVISPYSRLKTTNHTYYTMPSMVRTIEQILGLPPMNIQDAIAPLMSDCFINRPDKSPYVAIQNKISLNEMNPPLTSLTGKALHYARQSLLPQFDRIDSGDDDILNRILWFAAMGNIPYPSKYAGNEEEEKVKR
jgi:DNA-binding beta-propeller fold protein YncE